MYIKTVFFCHVFFKQIVVIFFYFLFSICFCHFCHFFCHCFFSHFVRERFSPSRRRRRPYPLCPEIVHESPGRRLLNTRVQNLARHAGASNHSGKPITGQLSQTDSSHGGGGRGGCCRNVQGVNRAGEGVGGSGGGRAGGGGR